MSVAKVKNALKNVAGYVLYISYTALGEIETFAVHSLCDFPNPKRGLLLENTIVATCARA